MAYTTRYFEYHRGETHKFWELTLDGVAFCVRFGRIGTKGQLQRKSRKTVPAAKAAANELMLAKHKKGYRHLPTPEPLAHRITFTKKDSRAPITRWGGLPNISPSLRRWPICGCCDEPMSFVLQVVCPDIELFGNQALHVFACLAGSDCGVYEPMSKSNHAELTPAKLGRSVLEPPEKTLVLPQRGLSLRAAPEPRADELEDAMDDDFDGVFKMIYGDKFYGKECCGNDSDVVFCPLCFKRQIFLADLTRGPMNDFESWFHTVLKICPDGHSASFQGVRG